MEIWANTFIVDIGKQMTKKNKGKAKLYKQWKRYLSNSRLSEDEIIKRAKTFTRKGMCPNES